MAKIILCCMNYRPEIISTGKYAFELCEYLAARGHDVEVMTTAPHYPGWTSFAGYNAWTYSVERLAGVRVWRIPMYLNKAASGIARFAMPLSWAMMATPVLLWRALVTRPDVIVAVQPTIMMAPSVLLAALLGGARTVQHVQDIEIDTALAVGHVRSGGTLIRFAYAAERFIMRRFDLVVTISSRMRDRLIGKGLDPSRVTIVRNWVDSTLIRPLDRVSAYRAELGIPDDAFVIQYSGQIGRKQALHLITDAAALLMSDRRFVFVIAGDGPMRPELERVASTLPNVILLPLQPTERLGEFLNLADCHILTQDAGVSDLVLPSKLGGMLASGKRMLVTADQDSELAGFLGDTATVIPPSSPAAIADTLRTMISTPDDGAPSRANRVKELEIRHILPRFEELLISAAR